MTQSLSPKTTRPPARRRRARPILPLARRSLVRVLAEHPLHLVAIVRLRQRDHQQHARLDRRVILAGDGELPARSCAGVGGVRRLVARRRSRRRDAAAAGARAGDDEHALRRRVVDALVLRAAGRARAGHRDHDALRAVVHRGLDQVARRALVDHDHVDARQLGHLGDVELDLLVVPLRDLVEEHDAIAIDDAELAVFAAAERLQPQRVGLGDVARGVDLVVQHHQRALVARAGFGGDAHAFEQVRRAFVADRARIAHRADDHDRPRIAHRQMQEERGLFERVGAARDDDAGQLLVGRRTAR